ncbi:hybrid sensor histidine kinase/response regulator [Haloarcula litorea]|uniref:hybrid sensor histidine kinase/response regulator n=1 Tax=Haloarcula litorea TaxID=3032579 RepID=UPI0023E7EBB9|nr:hybrid sensor histidine kinase/response regulator [Halomicroarcula sp. GDY20]
MSGTSAELDVLLVEDNPGDAKLVEHYLDLPTVSEFVEDLALDHEESLPTANDRLESRDYDVVLLDLGLPESTGLDTLDRATDLVDGTPIIVLTGMNDQETALEAVRRGAEDYLPKGDLDGDRLVRALRYAVVRRRQQTKLRRQADRMEFFNSILRHDMLNGMNVIRARAEMLERELHGQQAEFATTIVEWSDDIIDLTQKVRSVLDSVASEEMTETDQMALTPAVESAADRARSARPDCDVTVDVDDVVVVADDLLPDVFGNLLLNAVEHGYTPADSQTHGDGDGVTVEVTSTVRDTSAVVRVADDGPGVDPADRREIFERGEKGSESAGTGFGLYFVDAMIDSYGGQIHVEDSDLGGAAFVVELPLE